MPAYDEAATIVAVLDDLVPRVDYVVVVDDGSRDGTGDLLNTWAAGRDRCRIIHFPENRGLSAALRAGWDAVRAMLERGEIGPEDVTFSIDADGQHEPAAIDGMIDFLVENDCACVIGRRDLSYHTPYKVFGNKVMTWIGRLSGGRRFEDIESGYRVFRVGPLLKAQDYYDGYRYSETVEVAVILARMGYRVDNTYPVSIPVARTRTRLSDAAVDAVCMPLAWYRLACWRGVPRPLRSAAVAWVAALVVAAWVVALALMLTRGFYLGDDSAHSYAHVWYLSESLFTRHEWPWHVALLENGRAVMFPYGIVPWLPSAALYPVLGDWVVTLSMVLGVVLMVLAMWRFRPAMRNPILLGLFLLNPLLWNGVTQFQLATVWSFAFFFFGAAEFERVRHGRAVALLALSVATHPMMGTLALATYAAFESLSARRVQWKVARTWAIATALASPAIVLFLQAPLLKDTNLPFVILNAADNFRRLSIVLLALLLPGVRSWVFSHQRLLMGLGAAATAAVLVAVPPSGLWQRSEPPFAGYLAQHPAVQGEPYRVMVANNHEDGMVQFMKSGATLANEFFTESIRRQSFPSADAYECFLATRGVKHVVFSGEYLRKYRWNEPALLETLASRGYARQEYRAASGTLAYTVNVPASARRSSVRACGL